MKIIIKITSIILLLFHYHSTAMESCSETTQQERLFSFATNNALIVSHKLPYEIYNNSPPLSSAVDLTQSTHSDNPLKLLSDFSPRNINQYFWDIVCIEGEKDKPYYWDSYWQCNSIEQAAKRIRISTVLGLEHYKKLFTKTLYLTLLDNYKKSPEYSKVLHSYLEAYKQTKLEGLYMPQVKNSVINDIFAQAVKNFNFPSKNSIKMLYSDGSYMLLAVKKGLLGIYNQTVFEYNLFSKDHILLSTRRRLLYGLLNNHVSLHTNQADTLVVQEYYLKEELDKQVGYLTISTCHPSKADEQQELIRIKMLLCDYQSPIFSNDNRYMACICNKNFEVVIIDLTTKKNYRIANIEPQLFGANCTLSTNFIFSVDSKYLYIITNKGIVIEDIDKKALHYSLQDQENITYERRSLLVNSDDTLLVQCSVTKKSISKDWAPKHTMEGYDYQLLVQIYTTDVTNPSTNFKCIKKFNYPMHMHKLLYSSALNSTSTLLALMINDKMVLYDIVRAEEIISIDFLLEEGSIMFDKDDNLIIIDNTSYKKIKCSLLKELMSLTGLEAIGLGALIKNPATQKNN